MLCVMFVILLSIIIIIFFSFSLCLLFLSFKFYPFSTFRKTPFSFRYLSYLKTVNVEPLNWTIVILATYHCSWFYSVAITPCLFSTCDSNSDSFVSMDKDGGRVYHLPISSGRTPYLKNVIALTMASIKKASSLKILTTTNSLVLQIAKSQ